jgi:hypothetical protein
VSARDRLQWWTPTTELGLAAEDDRHEVAAALRLGPLTADERTRVAVELRDRLRSTLSSLCAGRISRRQAANVVDGVVVFLMRWSGRWRVGY